MLDLKTYIREIPDFPKPGILFRDITPLLANPGAFSQTVDQLAELARDLKVDLIAAAEARGFIFAAPVALKLGVGFVPVRKPGKLPFHKHALEYDLEYGSDTLEVHIDSISAGHRVLLVDDLLATGGTMQACIRLMEKARAKVVGCAFVIELTALHGRTRLTPVEAFSLLEY